MYVLGINCYMHDSAACLISDGRIISAAEEERFTREKHTGEFPLQAIRYCLAEAGISVEEVDRVAFYLRPWSGFSKRVLHILRHLPQSWSFKRRHGIAWLQMMNVQRYFQEKFNLNSGNVKKLPGFHFISHHEAHAASTFLLSPYQDASILTLDAAGEWGTTWLGYGKGNEMTCIREIGYPDGLGFLYGALTQYLGFRKWEDEYKVMGLASYGEPAYYDLFQRIIKPRQGGFKLDLSYFEFHLGRDKWYSDKLVRALGSPRQKGQEPMGHYADVAASLQTRLEDVVLNLCDYLYERTQLPRLCLAGGVALNAVMNGRLLRESPFTEIFIQPAAHDPGASLGAALLVYHRLNDNAPRYVMRDVYLGPQYAEREMEGALRKYGLSAEYRPDIASAVAELIAEGKIVGWFQGRMEFGPRALGNRSILADPRREEMKDILNERVKHRENFRPFAPSVLKERAAEYFDTNGHEAPFMVLVFPVHTAKRGEIPAVTHVDGTARIQTVDKEVNPRYWKLIHEFEKISGVPVVINTSFNVRGEPIVCSPEDAIKCFLGTGIDYLALGNFLVSKP